MKVPKLYKSSDRYNAGTDVIYNDDSKLQYAPFIYAGVTAKDNGDDGGDDEEGEDTMVVRSVDSVLDKTWKEIYDACKSGKVVQIWTELGTDEYPELTIEYVQGLYADSVDGYTVITGTGTYTAEEENGYPSYTDISG